MSSTTREEPKKQACGSGSQPCELSDADDRNPSVVKCRRPEDAQSQNRLHDLLHDKDFLWKVFGYLVEDGLYECRRVCRKWREVCSEFFTERIRVYWEDLADAHLKFPNAVSLSMLAYDEEMDDRQNVWSNIVPSLTGIKRLEMDLEFLWNCLQSEEFPQRFCTCVDSFVQLESLTLGTLDACTYSLISSMPHLTNLTHLKIDSALPFPLDMEPLSEVRKLKNLSVHAKSLFAENGSLTFPSLTELTQLEIECKPEFDVIFLEV